MKDGTDNLMKFKLLQRDLALPLWQARGLLDTLWLFVKRNCPRGDVGRFTDEEIAVGIDWQGDASALILALTARGWLDHSDQYRLIVHDWPDHAEDSVHKALARRLEFFADGTAPNWRRLEGQTKTAAENHYSNNTYDDSKKTAAHGQPVGEVLSPAYAPARPSPTKPSLAKPDHGGLPPGPESGGIKNRVAPETERALTEEVLRSPGRFEAYITHEQTRKSTLLVNPDAMALGRAAREKAVTDATLTSPVGFWKKTMRLHAEGKTDEAWSRVNGKHETAAKKTSRATPIRGPDPDVAAVVAAIERRRAAQ